MKKLLTIIFASVLVGAMCAACDEGVRAVEPMPKWGCWVFVTTTENPVLLLAKSGLSAESAFAISDSLGKIHGRWDVYWGFDYPADGYPEEEYYIAHPELVPDCYEITMTIEFEKSSVPSVDSLFGYGFRGVKITGTTAICKWYSWAFTETWAEQLIQSREYGWNKDKEYYGNGTIVGTSTIKKLGQEAPNEPIIF